MSTKPPLTLFSEVGDATCGEDRGKRGRSINARTNNPDNSLANPRDRIVVKRLSFAKVQVIIFHAAGTQLGDGLSLQLSAEGIRPSASCVLFGLEILDSTTEPRKPSAGRILGN